MAHRDAIPPGSPPDGTPPPASPSPVAGRSWPPGWTVEYVAETGSTNTDLIETAFERPDRSVRTTGHQTAGRGRLGRRWDAPPGANLLVSILFHQVPASPNELTRRIGLAAVHACREVAGVEATLKWPNDVLVGDRKLAGILAQRHQRGPVVVGMGLNVGWAPEGAARLGDGIDPMDVLEAVLHSYDALPDDVGPAYRAVLATLGKPVRVHLADGELEGRAVDVEPDGRLVVVDACAVTHRFDVGDVVHLR